MVATLSPGRVKSTAGPRRCHRGANEGSSPRKLRPRERFPCRTTRSAARARSVASARSVTGARNARNATSVRSASFFQESVGRRRDQGRPGDHAVRAAPARARRRRRADRATYGVHEGPAVGTFGMRGDPGYRRATVAGSTTRGGLPTGAPPRSRGPSPRGARGTPDMPLRRGARLRRWRSSIRHR